MLLLGRNGVRRFVFTTVTRAKLATGLAGACASKRIFHLWFHPSNFYYRRDEQLATLAWFLEQAAEQASRGDSRFSLWGNVHAALSKPPRHWPSAAMSQRRAAAVQDYLLVPAASVDAERLLAFDAVVRPDRRPRDRILTSWWQQRATSECATAAIHTPSGTMVGICAGRPSTWSFASGSIPSIGICEWFVDPAHFGKEIGKRMVQHFSTPGKLLYTFVISEAAIANFKRLGWVGPFIAPMLARPLPSVFAFARRGTGIELQDYTVRGPDMPAALGEALDRIEGRQVASVRAHMRRDAKELSWRLSLANERQYRFSVASRAGEPLGYVAVRARNARDQSAHRPAARGSRH